MRAQLQSAAVWPVLATEVMALALSAAPAVAQIRESAASITSFAGMAMTPGPHPATGVAVGLKPHPGPVSLEFEYSRTRRDPVASVPAIATFACNILVQPSHVRARANRWRVPLERAPLLCGICGRVLAENL